MKIEKINENQIRCILNSDDLRDRHLKISELAYGSQKAREFFQDIVLEANKECGFEAEDMPLMIEAIPTAGDSLILLLTKVDNPEELDTRFSNFTPYHENEDETYEPEETKNTNPFAESVLETFTQIGNSILSKLLGKEIAGAVTGKLNGPVSDQSPKEVTTEKRARRKRKTEEAPETVQLAKEKAFRFRDLDRVAAFAKCIRNTYNGGAVLYREPKEGSYHLVLLPEGADVDAYNTACNVACEYGVMLERSLSGMYAEHYQKIMSENTIPTLAEL